MENKYDVIIVGTGVSGLFCALHLPDSMKVLMITKDELENSDSFLAQGGICVLKNEDDFESYVEDTMRAGKYENNREAVELMIAKSREVINELIDYAVDFDKENGELVYTKEAAHSTNRILHHADITGAEITSKLLAAVKGKSNIELREYCEMADIISKDNRAYGIAVYENGEYTNLYAPSIVLATGGIGGVFAASTNFPHITADGVAFAIKNDIEVEHVDYIQIHPTTLYSKKKGRRFLISEAVRGEGAYLINPDGERFVNELLPRDVVSKTVGEEMKKFGTDHVFLSLKHLDADYIHERFPNIAKACKEEGYDLATDLVPITPAQHYFMGGVKVDLDSRTTMKGLYAVGETSCTGVHGANRLASNSLLEALVYSKRAAADIVREAERLEKKNPEGFTVPEDIKVELKPIEEIRQEDRQLVLDEIKRRDESFYDRWFTKEQ